MTFDARFVSDLRQLSSREALEIRAHEKQPRQVALFEIENELSPADIYCYFHARFGSLSVINVVMAATAPAAGRQ